MLLHGEQREEQSQAVIEGHVPAAEQAHMGAIQGSAERSSRQSHKPGVPDGERHDLHIYPKQAGADCGLWQTVGAAGRDPHGGYRVSLTGGRVLWVEWQAALHAQTPGSGRLADNTQLARRVSQGEARHYRLPKTRWVQWPAAVCLQLTWLIQLMDIYILVIFFRQGATRESQALQ